MTDSLNQTQAGRILLMIAIYLAGWISSDAVHDRKPVMAVAYTVLAMTCLLDVLQLRERHPLGRPIVFALLFAGVAVGFVGWRIYLS